VELLNTQNRIASLLGAFVQTVINHGAMNRTDLKSVSEVIVLPLLSEVFELRGLKSLNATEQINFPAIDLGDENVGVAIQVTSDPTSEKIKETLSKFVSHELYKRFGRLIIYVLTNKQNSYSGKGFDEIVRGKFEFDRVRDIVDRTDVIAKITHFDLSIGRRHITCEGPFAARRTLPINLSAARALKRYLPSRRKSPSDALFLNMFGQRLGLPGIRDILARAAHRAGIQKPVTPDIIRNSFAAHFLDGNGKEVTLKHILGHKTFAAVSRFSSVATEQVHRIYDRIHPRA